MIVHMKYDVVIVGASFSGLTLAHYLPKVLKVLVLDKKNALDAHIETTGLVTQATYDLLDEFCDVGKYCPNKIDSIGVIGTDYKRNFFSCTEDPWIYSTDTPLLVKHMSQTVPENVELKIGAKFVGAKHSSEEYPVDVTYEVDGEEKVAQTKFLVGADGVKSAVAKDNEKLSKNTRILIGLERVFYGDITFGPNPESTVYHYWFGEFSLGYGGWLSPTVIDGKKAFRLGLAKKAKGGGGFGKIDDFIAKLKDENMIKIADGTKEILTFSNMIPIGGPLRKVSDGNTLIIGDAAGLCGAFAADGIKGAVISGKVAARLIPQYLNGDRRALKGFHRDIQKYKNLMTYYRKQVFYRFLWDRMKSNRSFDTMFDIIAKSSDDFLNQFCDSKDRNKSLLSVVLRAKNLPLLLKYAWLMFIDLFKRG